MGHTFSNLIVHIVFSGKERKNMLYKDMRTSLFSYMCGIAKNIDCHIVRIGSIEDHVHILIKIPPNLSISDAVMKLKANSSKWIHETYPDMFDFSWQTGFSCFSVSESVKEDIIRYIDSQQEHHRRFSFVDEVKMFHDKNNIDTQGRLEHVLKHIKNK